MTITPEELKEIKAAAREAKWPVVWPEKKAVAHFRKKVTPDSIISLMAHIDDQAEQIAEQQAVIDQRNGECDRLINELAVLREYKSVGYILCNHREPDTGFVFTDFDAAAGSAEHLNDGVTLDRWSVEQIYICADDRDGGRLQND